MARRNPLRTPEGAWYRDYAEYKVQNRCSYPPQICGAEAQQKRYDGYALSPPPPSDTFDVQGGGYYHAEIERERKHYPWAIMADNRERNGGMGSRPPLYDYDENQREKREQEEEEAKGSFRQRKTWQRNNDAKGEFTLFDSSKRNGLEDKDWEPPEQFSPRKTTTYEPSFHYPAAYQKRVSSRELEKEDPRECMDGHGHGQMIAAGYDPRMARYEEPKQAVSQPSGGAFLFIRFPQIRGEYHHVTAKACLHALTSDLRGRFFGISKKVFDFGYPTGPEEGCVVFQFPSLEKAEVFFYRDKRFRQPDFPAPHGHAEVFAIDLQCDPNTMQSYDTFLLSEVILNDVVGPESLQEYETTFVKPFLELLSEPRFKALPYAAYCKTNKERLSLRRRYFPPNTIITLHLFQRPQDLEEVMADRRYSELRFIHNSIATERCSIFTVERQLCP